MNPLVAIVLFYGLLALATSILRGDLTDWPRWADCALSFGVAFAGVVMLVISWRGTEPAAVAAPGQSTKTPARWPWWAGVAAVLGFIYLAALPPLSVWLAQPGKMQRPTSGRDASKSEPPESTNPAPTTSQSPSPADGTLQDNGTTAPAAAMTAEVTEAGPLAPLRRRWEQNPPWLKNLAIAAALILMAVIIWLLWRLLRPAKQTGPTSPEKRPPWYEDADAPRYVREFARLCDRFGSPPRPGDTFRDLLARLSRTGHDIIELLPMTAYHYRVRYENAPANKRDERAFSQKLRALRKAPISAPATESVTEASATH
jgi:Domain of unknown function (DUF4129)